MTYETIGVQYYTKAGEEYTIIHYLKPIKSKNGEGLSGEKLFLKGSIDIRKGDLFKPVFELGYSGKPYLSGIEKVD